MTETRHQKIEPDTPVRFLRGVGPHRAQLFAQLGVHTAADLLEYYPRDYEFLPTLSLMGEVLPDQTVTVAGQIINARYNVRSRPTRFELTISDKTGRLRLLWFHGGYLRDEFLPGDVIAAWGKVSRYKEILQIVNPRWTKVQSLDELTDRRQVGEAKYPATADFSTRQIARVIRDSLPCLLDLAEEYFDDDYRAKHDLPTRRDALQWIHRPPSRELLNRARRRLAYDELFLMQLGLALRRERNRRQQQAHPLSINDRLDSRIRRLFPFILTEAQEKVIDEICSDMARPEPMNRLLQGDVGSGKTVVALYATLLAVGNHHQVAIMTPTEILAHQHFESIQRYLRHSRVRRALLTGGLTGKRRTHLMDRVCTGDIDIIVGTQALLQKDVRFKDLALVVVDEQHKFGVRQREIIRGKNLAPHYLVMTATPIPRTLAITVFGDLEVSVIDQLPPGRRDIITRWVPPDKLPEAHEFIRDRIKKGEQAYFVYPRIEETGDNLLDISPDDLQAAPPTRQLKAATAEHEYLQKQIFTECTVALLHGQMERDQKQKIMDDFRAGRIDILVATVVIEVGLDVPNATIMVIESAGQFGLAQLHQLRGRIGRGSKQSYCLLFGQGRTPAAQDRLKTMTDTSDGFRIAEQDLRIRGPGELFGTAQHGLPELKIANLIEDSDLLRMARRDAFALAKKDPYLKANQHQILRRALQERFGNDLPLADLG